MKSYDAPRPAIYQGKNPLLEAAADLQRQEADIYQNLRQVWFNGNESLESEFRANGGCAWAMKHWDKLGWCDSCHAAVFAPTRAHFRVCPWDWLAGKYVIPRPPLPPGFTPPQPLSEKVSQPLVTPKQSAVRPVKRRVFGLPF